MTKPTVAVVGASRDRSKYGNISLRAHLSRGYEVYPVNPNADEVEGIPCYASLVDVPGHPLDRVTVYLPPHQTMNLLDELEKLHPREIWLNPGSADSRVRQKADELGLEIIEACSIVDLGTSPSAFY